MGSTIFGWVCNALMACGPPAIAQPVQLGHPGVTVYHVSGPNPIQAQITLDQIQNIGLNCAQRDTIIGYLESRVGANPVNPETLDPNQRRINSAARSKIWQLRTYC